MFEENWEMVVHASIEGAMFKYVGRERRIFVRGSQRYGG